MSITEYVETEGYKIGRSPDETSLKPSEDRLRQRETSYSCTHLALTYNSEGDFD
jgi:hypothetical protein